MLYFPRVLNAFILSPYNKNTVISEEYTGPLDFHITGVNCIYIRSMLVSPELMEETIRLLGLKFGI